MKLAGFERKIDILNAIEELYPNARVVTLREHIRVTHEYETSIATMYHDLDLLTRAGCIEAYRRPEDELNPPFPHTVAPYYFRVISRGRYERNPDSTGGHFQPQFV